MEKRLEKYFWGLLFCVTLFYTWRACAARTQHGPINFVSKVFHHHHGKAKNTHIQAGNIVLYFTKNVKNEPKVTIHTDGAYEEQSFFLPNVQLKDDECKRMVTRVNSMITEPYTLSIKQVAQPSKGITLIVRYPRDLCAIECKYFNSIGRKKGLVVHIYNKKVLDAIKNHKTQVLQMASCARHRIPRIVIDDGHGGSDTGAVGCGHIQEKDICLRVGSKLAYLLQKEGYDVMLSRATDCDVPLDERTTRANSVNADLLISIHANSAVNENAHGIETFCITPELFTRDNTVSNSHFSTVTDAFFAQQAKKSALLAHRVQSYLCKSVASKNSKVRNRGVKHAAAQVLLGSHMPSILVELGFVSNPYEANLLSSNSYQALLAQGIFCGIRDMLKEKVRMF